MRTIIVYFNVHLPGYIQGLFKAGGISEIFDQIIHITNYCSMNGVLVGTNNNLPEDKGQEKVCAQPGKKEEQNKLRKNRRSE